MPAKKASTAPMTHAILTTPAPGTVISPLHTHTPEQLSQITALRVYADTIILPASDAYAPWERRWLARTDTLPRYMRAAKWKLDDAQRRLRSTLEWRRNFQPDLIRPDDVQVESESGKIILSGFDNDGRPIIYMQPAKENTETSDRQLRHLVFILERAKDLQPEGQESITILVDYRGTTLRTNPSISIARKVLVILQNHYVETLGRGIVVHLPMLLNFFFKGITPFLDPVTRDKIRFNPDLLELIPRSQLPTSLGGDYPYEFEPNAYWTSLLAAAHIAPDGTRTIPLDSRSRSSSMDPADDARTLADSQPATPPTKASLLASPTAAVAPGLVAV